MLSRRSFIAGGVLLTIGGSSAVIYELKKHHKKLRDQAVRTLVDDLSKQPGAIRIGKLLLHVEKDEKLQIQSITDIRKRFYHTHGHFGTSTIGEALDRQIQLEIDSDMLHKIDGWYLTKTEAELCMLAAMYSKS